MTTSKNRIRIVPIGDVDQEIVEDVGTSLKEILAMEVEIVPAIKEPEYAYNPSEMVMTAVASLSDLIDPERKGGDEQWPSSWLCIL